MRVTIYGPNLPRSLSETGTLHVHKLGCADTRKMAYRAVVDLWTIEADTIADIIEDIYPSDNFDYDSTDASEYAGYRNDVHVFPCVTIPER